MEVDFPSPVSIASTMTGQLAPREEAVSDLLSGRSFLVDTGAEESVFLASLIDRKKTRGPNLVAANGSAIATYGKRSTLLKLSPATHPGLKRKSPWKKNIFQARSRPWLYDPQPLPPWP
ncbi:Gag-pol polyprotein [Elysia marginata]|uniref:Gag-pol polyprotein n=1 Tax=Elysia marginata TaxID=1093978 RepID=A0AAV4GNF2_9GAST|nr:Gag-pol polyprotein [Elysia marginata]